MNPQTDSVRLYHLARQRQEEYRQQRIREAQRAQAAELTAAWDDALSYCNTLAEVDAVNEAFTEAAAAMRRSWGKK